MPSSLYSFAFGHLGAFLLIGTYSPPARSWLWCEKNQGEDAESVLGTGKRWGSDSALSTGERQGC